MKQEYFDIYDEDMKHIGTKLRSEVHKEGFWHKSFQCWFVGIDNEEEYIMFQKRQFDKDTYPNLLDITAAGHLSAGETVEDACREIKEELGLDVKFQEVTPIGIIKEQKSEVNFIDNEFANVFLYYCSTPIEKFKLQQEEVTGIYKVNLSDIVKLFNKKIDFVDMNGYKINESGDKEKNDIKALLMDFVPHDFSYYDKVFKCAKELLQSI
ncbi:hydrolase, NUDIX family [Clostridiales bacterium oral taxon 876 str. F0540]|nr:hydrolase, NUDIX family [Clostridiales bacterium oral taxon 876 str. F0540]